jgi:hypothetical protein
MARRGKRWQADVEALHVALVWLHAEMLAKAALGEDFARHRAIWWRLMARYNALHGAGEMGR